jgi:hypothetical protein
MNRKAHDNDNGRFTHAEVMITLPAGWALVSSGPSGRTQNGTLVTCPSCTLLFESAHQAGRRHELRQECAFGSMDYLCDSFV